jgi:23S rRNA (cytidine1920-2'-O)/16S rRNA (cytidine1409-2'-O)-methyltransferase
MAKERLDLILIEKGFFESRQKAQSAIISGLVKVGNKIINKAGTLIKPEEEIVIIRPLEEKYVSRGGFKLEKALETFKPETENKIFLDIGASTGGFTDCLLQNKAKFVYAIDVGYGQIDWKIRQDPRVKVIERCNARYLTPEELYKEKTEKASGCVMDVSFISLDKIIPPIINLLDDDFYIISLVKPQFEAGREKVKKGVVTSPDTHLEVLENFQNMLTANNLSLAGLTYSPIKGPSGNMEFLAFVKKKSDIIVNLKNIVEEAHNSL